MKKTVVLSAAIVLLFSACNSGSKNSKETTDTAATANNQPATADSITDTPATDAAPADTAIASKVKAIRENFNRINAVTKWSSVLNKELWESTEGGEATAYISNTGLEKISTKHFGETGQVVSEYYLHNNQLSFVYQKVLHYNRPIYYDSAAMKENNDTEVFDIGKSAVSETRSYFNNQKMIHQVSKEPVTGIHTEKEILEAFDKLRKLYKK